MFSGIEFGGSNGAQMSPGQDGDEHATRPSAGEVIPFEYRLMTKREISEYFGITERTIEVWMRRRYIPYIKIGQTVRFRVASVLRYVDGKYLVPAGEPRRPNRGKFVHSGSNHPGRVGASAHVPCEAAGTMAGSRGNSITFSGEGDTSENHACPSSLGTTSK
jgi:excisionase family DNA binding protein